MKKLFTFIIIVIILLGFLYSQASEAADNLTPPDNGYINTLYYTFSTIAQVLAGFIALSGVFVLFKLQELKKIQLAQANSFLTLALRIEPSSYIPNYLIDLNTLTKCELTTEMSNEMEKILKVPVVIKYRGANNLSEYQILVEKVEKTKRLIIKLTKYALIIGISAILFSLTILGLTHKIHIECQSNIIIFAGISLAMCTIVLMTIVIIKSLNDFMIINSQPTLVDDEGLDIVPPVE